MAEQKKDGYDVSLEVFSIKSVTPRQKGVFEDDSGKEIEYKDAVRIDLTRIVEKEVEGFGTVPTEEPLSIVISCDDIKEAQLLYKHILEMQKKGISFKPDIVFPKKVKSAVGGLEFITKYPIS